MILGLYTGDNEDDGRWFSAFQVVAPELELRFWPNWEELSEIDYVLVWAPPTDLLVRCTNLKAIVSLGAGVEHLLAIKERLPQGVPIVRMADQGLKNCMVEYILQHVLFHHRRALDYKAQQAERQWQALPPVLAKNRRIGFMGLGNMVRPAAELLKTMGFPVSAWVRRSRKIDGITLYAGCERFRTFLNHTDILVSLLPLTPETEKLLDKESFSCLPRGAAVINAGRGQTLVDSDLVEALDSGHLSGASLDVFEHEPLPSSSALWTHPRIVITPHNASPTVIEPVVEYVAKVISQLEAGMTPDNLADLSVGY